jgi:cysteine desulfurase
LIVALGEAAEIAGRERAAEAERLAGLRALFLATADAAARGRHGPWRFTNRIPGNLNLGFAGVSALDLMAALPDLALSVGSACTSAEVEPSYVLTALGLDGTTAASAVRVGFGRFTTEAELVRAADRLAGAVTALRAAGLQPALEAAT